MRTQLRRSAQSTHIPCRHADMAFFGTTCEMGNLNLSNRRIAILLTPLCTNEWFCNIVLASCSVAFHGTLVSLAANRNISNEISVVSTKKSGSPHKCQTKNKLHFTFVTTPTNVDAINSISDTK